jgi:hypothetical protein
MTLHCCALKKGVEKSRRDGYINWRNYERKGD